MKVAEVPIGNTPNQIWSNLLRKDPRAKRGKKYGFQEVIQGEIKNNVQKNRLENDKYFLVFLKNHPLLLISTFTLNLEFSKFRCRASRGFSFFFLFYSVFDFPAALRATFHFSSCSIAFSILLRAHTYSDGNMRINCERPNGAKKYLNHRFWLRIPCNSRK